MKVELIAHTPDPDALCSRIAQVCYSSKGFNDIEPDRRILREVIDSGHESVIEHANFTFSITGISRVTSHQLVRHRLASYTQQSQRYVDSSYTTRKLPESIRVVLEKDKKAENCFTDLNEQLDFMIDVLKEHNVPDEDMRYLFFNATETNIIVTMNARELLHFFRLRCCNRAQWEIREMANKMLSECQKVAPVIFKKAGAPCEYGVCPEGKRSCGKHKRD